MVDAGTSRDASRPASGGTRGEAAHRNGASAHASANPHHHDDRAAHHVDTSSQRLAELESLVAERDQLVTALTVQLEEAAERLDRVQRMGADRGPRVIGGIPKEFVEDQKSLIEEVQRAVQQWNDFQANAALGRIEMQIGELRDLVSAKLTAVPAGYVPASHSALHHEAEVEGEEEDEETHAAPAASSWAALKESLLEKDRPKDSAPAKKKRAPQRIEPEAPEDEGDAVPAPEAIDLAHASREELTAAVDQRDTYLTWLLRRVRTADLRAARADIERDETPDEIRGRLIHHEQAFQEQQRLMEVELSIERARLGREEARLRAMEGQIQKEMKRLGVHGPDARPASQSTQGHAHEPSDGGKGRWRRLLGMGADE